MNKAVERIDNAIGSLQEHWQSLKPEHVQEWLDEIEQATNQLKQSTPSLEAIIAKIEAEKIPTPTGIDVATDNKRQQEERLYTNRMADKAISIIREEGGV